MEESIASTQRDLYGFLEITCARSRDGDYDCNVEMNFGMGRARILGIFCFTRCFMAFSLLI